MISKKIIPLLLLSYLCLHCFSSCQQLSEQAAEQVVEKIKPKIATEEDYYEFAEELETRINERDPSFFNEHFDLSNILQNLVTEVAAPDSFKTGFINGVEKSLNIGEQIVGSLGIEGNYKLLRINNFPERPTAVFRLISREGLNYHEIYLNQPEEGDTTIQIQDFYIYMGAQVFSTTLKRLYLSSLPDSTNASITSKKDTSTVEKAFVSHLSEIEEIGKMILNESHNKALDKINSLPQILQKDKMILIMRVNVAFNADSLLYEQAVADFKKYHPKDPVIELMALDFSFLKGNYTRSLVAIDHLNEKVGNDPYLNVMKADIYQDLKQWDTAEKLLHLAIEEEPDNEEAYWSLVLLYLDQEKYPETVEIFGTMYEKFQLNPAETLIKDQYQEFWSSDAYKQWAEMHPINETISQP